MMDSSRRYTYERNAAGRDKELGESYCQESVGPINVV